ncbi:MAG TPA: hypothetical protein VL283_05605 [Candidatus Baltobacteraceae bacterium]|jgi:hypothetical protein|nr:hypothetical protein [Candidatus Baltobacteraceae bacterium]
MTSESGSDRERVKFGPLFAACSNGKTLIVACGLVLFGTGSIIAFATGLTAHLPPVHPKMPEWIERTCFVSYVFSLFISLVGSVSLFIHGLNRSGEVVIRGTRYRGMSLSKVALSIFTLPWILLGILIAFFGLR